MDLTEDSEAIGAKLRHAAGLAAAWDGVEGNGKPKKKPVQVRNVAPRDGGQ